MTSFPGPFVLDNTVPGFDRVKAFSQKIAEAKRWTIINLEIRLKGMTAQVDRTRYFMLQLNRSISGTCYFLDAQFRDMPRSAISARRGSNLI